MWFVGLLRSVPVDKFVDLKSDPWVIISYYGLSCVPLKFSCWTLTPMISEHDCIRSTVFKETIKLE